MLLGAFVLAAVIGFSLNRASICTVKAMAEILSSHRAHMLISIVKTVFWVELTVLVVMWLCPWPIASFPRWTASWLSVGGGFVFGMGAAVNGGCALSTLSRLGEGEFGMLLTLASMLVAAVALRAMLGAAAQPGQLPAINPARISTGLIVVAALGALWGIAELIRLWRLTSPMAFPFGALLATSYRLSGAALLIGISNGLLFSAWGPWTFTSAIERDLDWHLGLGAGPTALQWALFGAVVFGAALSALHRRRFRPRYRPSLPWLGNLTGGALMGAGAAVTPGGNDALLLQGVPGLSPHALPALAGMLAGIASTLVLRRALGGKYPQVVCTDDRCVEEPPPSPLLETPRSEPVPRA